VSPHVAWYVARAAGLVAWALLSTSVVWGLLLAVRFGRRPSPRWLLDLHRFLGGLAVVFTGVHLVGLVADTTVPFDVVDLLIPGASPWRPVPVALGVVALWLLLAVELTSLLMRRLSRQAWHRVHLASYGLFWMATLHGVTAGTDSHSLVAVLSVDVAVSVVVFLTLVRALAPRSRRVKAPLPATAQKESRMGPTVDLAPGRAARPPAVSGSRT
jgi:sulfoxide reductase heme-binding subunit YedZ